MEKYIDLAKKLKALADKGIGGEKMNASEMLDRLLKKHNLKFEDIEDEKQNDYYFNIDEDKLKLFHQIVKHVNHKINCYKFPPSVVKKYKLEEAYMITCTVAEYFEIESKFDFYGKLFQDELNIFFRAFCDANSLLVSSNENSKSINDLTENELRDLVRAKQMAGKIKVGQFLKQIKM